MKTYKHAASVTSQVYFCAAPIRLDTYDTCQLSCTYCFSRERSRYQASAGVHAANAKALHARLDRVQHGKIGSALDEFLARRIPIQLGGLQDPFTSLEESSGVTLDLLQVLRDFGYPTLISTKGSVFLKENYLKVLADMNVVFRISAAAISDKLRPTVERKGESFNATLEKISKLRSHEIPVALRIQPVFPSFEEVALEMADRASERGVGQVTFEYLKLPSESVRVEMSSLRMTFGFDYLQIMEQMGLRRVGPDWTLTTEAKIPFVRRAFQKCRELGVRFGAGDTEFIPWSDGDGCCGSSSLFLASANQFTANFVGVIKEALASNSKKIRFEQLEQVWTPQRSIGNYLDWRARVKPDNRNGRSDWLALLARRWNGGRSPYSPAFFYGVNRTGERDQLGFEVYDATQLADELNSLSNTKALTRQTQ